MSDCYQLLLWPASEFAAPTKIFPFSFINLALLKLYINNNEESWEANPIKKLVSLSKESKITTSTYDFLDGSQGK